jgi:hypothetical protein
VRRAPVETGAQGDCRDGCAGRLSRRVRRATVETGAQGDCRDGCAGRLWSIGLRARAAAAELGYRVVTEGEEDRRRK